VLITAEIPGPIGNEHLMEALYGEKSRNKLVPNTDYKQLSSAMWRFLHAIYGGGPAVKLPLTSHPTFKLRAAAVTGTKGSALMAWLEVTAEKLVRHCSVS